MERRHQQNVVCGIWCGTMAHISAECPKLARGRSKKRRYDEVVKVLYWDLCQKSGFEIDHQVGKVLGSEKCKILDNFLIQTDKKIKNNNKSGITLMNKEKHKLLTN